MTGTPEQRAILSDQDSNEFSPKVIFFAHLLNQTPHMIVETDYNPKHSLRDEKRNERLQRQIQPALKRLSQDPKFTATVESVRESMMPELCEGTCTIDLDLTEKSQLKELLESNGANLKGTSAKKIIDSVSF